MASVESVELDLADEQNAQEEAHAPGQTPTPQTPTAARARQVAAKLKRRKFPVSRRLQTGFAHELANFSIFDDICDEDREGCVALASASPEGERAMGAMVGMAVADSLGHLFEFLPAIDGAQSCCSGWWRWPKGHAFDARTLAVVGAYNKFGLKQGQWTDDTAMALCLADSLLVHQGYDGSDIRIRIWTWWSYGYNNAFRFDNSRHGSVGLGENVARSLDDVTTPNPTPRFHGDGEDAGNGPLIRLAPVPIFFYRDEDLAVSMSVESSYTTHPGPLAADACGFMGFTIARAMVRKPIDGGRAELASEFLDACVEAYLERPGVTASQPTLVRLLRSREPVGSLERCWNWRDPAGPFIGPTLKARGRFYNGYPVTAGYFGSFCMDGLAIALHSMYHTTSFMEALERCVNFLGDADSTGAILGQLAGAFYGIRAVDPRLVAHLTKWDRGEVALRGALLAALAPARDDGRRTQGV